MTSDTIWREAPSSVAANWTAFETRINQFIYLVLCRIQEGFALYDADIPFGLSVDEFMQYSSDEGVRRVRDNQQCSRMAAGVDRCRLFAAATGGQLSR